MLNLDEKKWNVFFLKDLFPEIQRGKRLIKDKHVTGRMPYISSTALQNGVDNFIGNKSDIRVFANCLSIANSGSVGTSFFQPFKFVASDHITHLKNPSFKKQHYLFIATITSRLSDKYNFNREINDLRISREQILLPTNSYDQPDYAFMKDYVSDLEDKKRKVYLKYLEKVVGNLEYKEIPKLNEKTWGEFQFKDIFEIHHGKRLIKEKRINGRIPLLTAGEKGNGVSSFISNIDINRHKDFISIDMFGNSFYHSYEASGDDNIYFLVNSNISPQSKMFIVTCINKQKSKYSYGKQFRQNNAENSKILLPISGDGQPDYNFMDSFIKNTLYIKLNDYLQYSNSFFALKEKQINGNQRTNT